jgi:hypothetical protein
MGQSFAIRIARLVGPATRRYIVQLAKRPNDDRTWFQFANLDPPLANERLAGNQVWWHTGSNWSGRSAQLEPFPVGYNVEPDVEG